jgi:hypothetical protein
LTHTGGGTLLEPMNERFGKGRRRGMNYLSNLGRMIRDLTGFATLTFELVQNADDAGASFLRFDVRDDVLVVFNDAVFSNCGDQDLAPDECLMLSAEGHKCDFHSFCDVGGGDKQDRDDTTGAFGIGFTAVYQIADTAELISNGLHWFINEVEPEHERIRECLGCPRDKWAGTTFILPWARDANSEFRRRTRTPPVSPHAPGQLLAVLFDKIPTAMLFLRHVRCVELCRNGERVDLFSRENAGELCAITGTGSRREWLMLSGEFAEEARTFFASNATLDDRRRSSVSLAIPLDEDVHGLLCAYLPTDEPSRLPLHVNADFFPGSDRRRLLVEGLRGDWNRLAMRAVARTLADNLEVLVEALSPTRLWQALFAAHQAKEEAEGLGLEAYWAILAPVVPNAPVMWTTASEWTAPSRAYLLGSPTEERAVVPLLERLGVSVVHPDVAGHVRRMSGWAGAQEFTLTALTAALAPADSDPPDKLARLFPQSEERLVLWEEAERLLTRKKAGDDLEAFRRVRIMPGLDGGLRPARDLFLADSPTVRLVADIGIPVQPLDMAALPPDASRLRSLCDPLDVRFMLTMLSRYDGKQNLTDALMSGRLEAATLLTWLAEREEEIIRWKNQARIAALPIFPTSSGYSILDDASLPGGFVDRLGVADTIDTTRIAGCEGFLIRLGARRLTRQLYLTEFVPDAAQDPSIVASGAWRELILDLARELDEIAADDRVRAALRPLPLVPVTFRGERTLAPAADAYFPTQEVRGVFGDDVRLAELISGHEIVSDALFRWLGVSEAPRLEDLISHVRMLVGQPPAEEVRDRVTGAIRYLGTLVRDRRTSLPPTVESLREFAWLPTERDSSRWYRPSEVQTTARRYLFETQGRFLDVPHEVQQAAADFLRWLGVTANPTVTQVVAHLLACAEQGQPVNQEVFLELSRNVEDPAIDRLVGRKCLLIDDNRYVKPDDVFRDENPFGRFRRQLAPQWDSYSLLLERLGVKKRPDSEDAIRVLLDIASDLAAYHSPVEDADDLAVIWHCWSLLDDALKAGPADRFAVLRERPVIPDTNFVLTKPTRLVIDDMPGVVDALHLGASILERKEGLWRAFEAAGVQSLSAAIRIEIVDRPPADCEGLVAARIGERKHALARVVDDSHSGNQRLDDLLSTLTIHETSSLTVRYQLPAFDRTSDEVSVAAVYLPTGDQPTPELLVCVAGDRSPWMAVARELSRALAPGRAPGLLATTLFVVLNAATYQEADAYLDEAGLPRLDVGKLPGPPAASTAGLGGEVSSDEDGTDQPSAAADGQGSQAGQPAQGDGAEGSQEDGSETDADGNGAAGAESESEPPEEPGAHTRTSSAGQPGRSRASGAGTGGQGPRTGNKRTEGLGDRKTRTRGVDPSAGRQTRLRSYVVEIDEEEGDQGTVGDEAPDLSSIDIAGVARVLEYERKCGRAPCEMAHGNAGFDVESFDKRGKLVRRIEIKSTGSQWSIAGVMLSRRQHEQAVEDGDRFWLYVVENAQDDDYMIYRIQDPASRIDYFGFDGGWKDVAEPDVERDEARTPTVGAMRSLLNRSAWAR